MYKTKNDFYTIQLSDEPKIADNKTTTIVKKNYVAAASSTIHGYI